MMSPMIIKKLLAITITIIISHFSNDARLKKCPSAFPVYAIRVPSTYFREHVKSYVSVAFPVYTMTLEKSRRIGAGLTSLLRMNSLI